MNQGLDERTVDNSKLVETDLSEISANEVLSLEFCLLGTFAEIHEIRKFSLTHRESSRAPVNSLNILETAYEDLRQAALEGKSVTQGTK